jgi:ribulose 1,5-bisphosphate carboxylase large subunit-like protein
VSQVERSDHCAKANVYANVVTLGFPVITQLNSATETFNAALHDHDLMKTVSISQTIRADLVASTI